MKGKPEVLAELSKALKEELGAILQYFLHAEMCENWGYTRLSDFIKKQSIGEMKHAEVLTERILFLEGIPNVSDVPKLNIGKDVKQQLESDLALEVGAVADYNHAIATCINVGDNATADLFKELLNDEEGHVDFLETQLSLIKDLGIENYLVEQMGEEKEGE